MIVRTSVSATIYSPLRRSDCWHFWFVCLFHYYWADYIETSRDETRHGSVQAFSFVFFHRPTCDPEMRSSEIKVSILSILLDRPLRNAYKLMQHIGLQNPSEFLSPVMWPRNDVNAENIEFYYDTFWLRRHGFWHCANVHDSSFSDFSIFSHMTQKWSQIPKTWFLATLLFKLWSSKLMEW